MIYIIFLLAAAVVVLAAIKLNKFGDIISQKSVLSGAAVGTFLIAGATSLPELTTSLTAVYIDNPDIAVGNMIGSNVFNLLILAVVDMIYRKRRLFQRVGYREHVPSAIVGLLFMLIIITALLIPGSIEWFGVGIEMFVMVGVYIVVVKFLSNEGEESAADIEVPVKDYSLRQAVIRFVLLALVVFGAGSVLSIAGDQLAQVSGMDSSFVGSFLIAASTSLPELVTVLAAFKVANYGMAIGSILGSNMFNMQLLVVTDFLYRDRAILEAAGSSHIFMALLVVFMTVMIIYLLLRPRISSSWRYAAPSFVISVVYVVVSFMLF
ncbi:sodium/calcium exchanger membrane protein [Halobacillus andaensis]|uniref:Sodium/calcium exchanger membrane protein n=1 Tax=Halobacillus andaensis TaxID=1176239 RepID=A0A917EZD5_HALAA|nr:sodium:calcium antiporter [Halobacillus andaensis]MBP2005720.1 cation:H+ antiporter [Halobacillus andaensis]GGF26520.1 sodium/calcium exchanger membrane protein [Halobacillus andaensis]